MPTVYLPQNPMKKDPETQELKYKLDQQKLQRYGVIEEVCPFSAINRSNKSILKHIKKVLKKYNFNEGDLVFLSGDSIVITCCIAFLVQHHKNFRILRWNYNEQDYEIHDFYTSNDDQSSQLNEGSKDDTTYR